MLLEWAWKAAWLLLWLHPAPNNCSWWSEAPSSTLGATWLEGAPCLLLPQLLCPTCRSASAPYCTVFSSETGDVQRGRSMARAEPHSRRAAKPRGAGFSGVACFVPCGDGSCFSGTRKTMGVFWTKDVELLEHRHRSLQCKLGEQHLGPAHQLTQSVFVNTICSWQRACSLLGCRHKLCCFRAE